LPEHDGRGESDGVEEDHRASAVAGWYASPVLQPAERDLDPVAAFVVLDVLPSRFSAMPA